MSLRPARIGPGRGLRAAQLPGRVLLCQGPLSCGFDPQNRAAFLLVPDPASDPPRTHLKADSRVRAAGAPGTRAFGPNAQMDTASTHNQGFLGG